MNFLFPYVSISSQSTYFYLQSHDLILQTEYVA